jgi:hypothetical protein
MTTDTTRRTLAQARRMPQWARLMYSIHNAQAAKGYAGRYFSAAEMKFFNETLIGKPVELVAHTKDPRDFSAHWVARQVFENADGGVSVRYALKAVYGDNLANVNTLDELHLEDPTTAEDQAAAAEYVRRANFQTGAKS